MAMPTASVIDLLRAHPRPEYWSGHEVRRWLEAIELDVYAPTFEAAGVEGSDLIKMDADGLKRRLGVASLGHRTKLMQNIAVLSSRASQGFKRDEQSKEIAMKKKNTMEAMYPDRVRREEKQKQDEKLMQARAEFWTPEDRGMQPSKPRTRPSSAAKQRSDDALLDNNSSSKHILEDPEPHPPVRRPARSAVAARRAGAPPLPRPSTAKRVVQRRAPAQQQTVERGGGREEDGDEDDLAGTLLPPSERKAICSERIKKLEGTEEYEELVKALVEYGACLRIEGDDFHPGLVRTHFNLGTTYLRQKLVPQALSHFKQAEEVNEKNGEAREAVSFRCRILEGMGICETRMGHYSTAQNLLDKAKRLCVKDDEGGEGGGEGEGEGGDDDAGSGATASVLVAMSELHSAQGHYDDAVDSLIEAWQLKEAELSPTHPQVGKLFSAMGTIKQKQLRYKSDLLADVTATLDSAQRIKEEIDTKTEGMQLKVSEEERTVAQLGRDIGNMSRQRRELEKEVLACKADVLEYMNRAKKVALHNCNDHPDPGSDAAKLVALVDTLAARFAREEAARLATMMEEEKAAKAAEGGIERQDSGDDKLAKWLAAKGESLRDLGLEPAEQKMEQTEELITRFRQQAGGMV